MAATTKYMNSVKATLGVKINGAASYTDITGSSIKVTPGALTWSSSEVVPMGETKPVGLRGASEGMNIKVQVFYTEEAAEAWILLRAAAVAGQTVQIKHTPAGTTAGADYYESSADGFIIDITPPETIGGDAEKLTGEFTIWSSSWDLTAS